MTDPQARSAARSDPWPEDQDADRAAIRRVIEGDASALADLYDRHVRRVYSLALRIVEDQPDAEDLVQEVFSQAWRQAARFDAARGTVAAWLLTMTRSRAIDRLRARRAKPDTSSLSGTALEALLPDPGTNQEGRALSGELAGRIRRALAGLPLLQRLAIEMAYYEGLTQDEIAGRLETPLGTIKTRIRLGLMKLREALAEGPQ